MAQARSGCLVPAVWVTLGVGLYGLAAGLLYLLADPLVGRPLASGTLAVAMVLVPLGVTALLMRGFRRLDESTTFWRNAPGIAAVWSLLLVVVLLVGARGAVAVALERVPQRYPRAGSLAHTVAATVGRWLAPSPPPPPPPPPPTPARAPTPPSPPVDTAPPTDAGVLRVPTAPAPPLSPPVDAATPADVPAAGDAVAVAGFVSEAAVCERLERVFPVDLGNGPSDELVAVCADGVRVLWLHGAGGLEERTRIVPHAPPGVEVGGMSGAVFDMDADGRPDVVLCAYWVTENGGTRDGDTWWAPGQANGQFGRPVRLVGGLACAGVDFADINGDGGAEMLLVERGNPYQTAHPVGAVRWYTPAGHGRWTQRGRVDVLLAPYDLWPGDANHDGITDVMVNHDWENEGVEVLPGSRRGLLPIDHAVTALPRPDRTVVAANLDGDGVPDRVVNRGRTLRFEATSALTPAPTAVSRALDYVEYTP